MSPSQQDAFMEDSEDTCPLCVEEFDLSDKNFRPCPCGYQICQFCYNNIKTNMNGLCPACRRPYDDKNIEWKIISPEEFKAEVANQARRKAAVRQKEAERRQVETLNRKHLQGLRVVQRNLVYITGMSSEGVNDERLEEELKGPKIFGQYGRIIKLSANKLKDTGPGAVALAIFITFADDDAASRCIAALDGIVHQNRILKAQHGTTKYCSAFLRNETCNNRNCTFLHETGEDRDSFSRQELSSLNAASSQARPAQTGTPTPRPLPPQQTPSTTGGPSTQPMSRSDSGDGPALPSTANWAKNPQLQQSRRSSLAASRATPSPKTTHAKTILARPASRASSKALGSSAISKEQESSQEPQPTQASEIIVKKSAAVPAASNIPSESYLRLLKALHKLASCTLEWSLDRGSLDEETIRTLETHPPLIDPNGGIARAALRQRQEKMRLKQDEARSIVQAVTQIDDDDHRLGGSLQLGGEPDIGDDAMEARSRGVGNNIFQHSSFENDAVSSPPFGQASLTNDFSSLDNVGRGAVPQQRGGVSLLKNNQDNDAILQQFQRAPTSSQHHSTLSNPFAGQNPVLSAHSRHGRQSSRFTFANDAASATASVKSTANPLLPQQNNMISAQGKQYSAQPSMQTGFYSGVQGPPPGLKSSGTPPISGGGMFGQGHGFASAMGGGLSFNNSHLQGKANDNDSLSMRGRSGTGGGLGPDAGKQHDSSAPAYDPLDLLGRGSPRPIIRTAVKSEIQAQSRTVTPSLPPGLGAIEFPPLAPPKAAETSAVTVVKDRLEAGKVIQTSSVKKGKQKEKPVESNEVDPAKTATVETTEAAKEDVASEPVAPPPPTNGSPTKAETEKKVGKIFLQESSQEPKNPSDRRQKPGKLDIAAAQDAAKQDFKDEEKPARKDASAAVAISKDTASMGQEPSRSVTPATGGTPAETPAPVAPVSRGPRTIRVIDTPKTETPTKQSAMFKGTPVESVPGSASMFSAKTPSRRPSVGSINVPSTPSGDMHSETASWVESHPASPAGGKPALPTRVKTKSQAKKERRTRKTEESKLSESVSVDILEPEIVQEAIIGRKKKAKKEKPMPVKTIAKTNDKGATEPSPDSATKIEPEVEPEVATTASPAPREVELESPAPKVPLTLRERADRVTLTDLLHSYYSDFKRADQAADLLTSPPHWKVVPGVPRTMLPQLTDDELALLQAGKPVLVQGEVDPEDAMESSTTVKDIYTWTVILPDASRTILSMATRVEGELYLSLFEELLGQPSSAANSLFDQQASSSDQAPATNGAGFITAIVKSMPHLFASLWDIFPPPIQVEHASAGPTPSLAVRVNDLIRSESFAAKWMDENNREIELAEAQVGGDYFTRRRAAALGHGPVSLDSVAAAAPPPGSSSVLGSIPRTGHVTNTNAAARAVQVVPGIDSLPDPRSTAASSAPAKGSAISQRNAAAFRGPHAVSGQEIAAMESADWYRADAMRLTNEDLADELRSMPTLADIERRLRESESFAALCKREDEQQEKRFQAALRKNAKVLKRGVAVNAGHNGAGMKAGR